VAGKRKYGQPLIVIDFGTATTFDCIDAGGDYLGGVIAPGIETSIHSLHLKAARLPQVDLAFPESVIGRTTDESIQSGVLIGTVAMIEGMVSRINEAWGCRARVVATGGLSKIISKQTDIIEAFDPYLSLEGMIQIYEMNQK
jgi:type III pantothenate kinase